MTYTNSWKYFRVEGISISIFIFAHALYLIGDISDLGGYGSAVYFKLPAILLFLITPLFHFQICYRKLLALLSLVIILAWNFYISFNVMAATDELIRYLIPVAIVMFLSNRREGLALLSIVFIWFVVVNDVYQVYVYLSVMLDLPRVIPLRYEAGNLIRAEGLTGFFSTFGFINLCGYILLRYRLVEIGFRKSLMRFFLLFIFLSLSLKAIVGLFIFTLFTLKEKKSFWLLGSVFLGFLLVLFAKTEIVLELYNITIEKLKYYILVGNSARSESYRVMFESLFSFNLIGEGLGYFGGPASTKYSSPAYELYEFNWYGLQGLLSTTDTLYPHIFVELGLFGGLIYFYLTLFSYVNYVTYRWLGILIAFLVDNAFSFALLNPLYYSSALLIFLLLSGYRVGQNHGRETNRDGLE